MATNSKEFGELFSVLTNALQAAAPLATRLRRELGEQAEEAVTLEAAIERAVGAVRQLRSRPDQEV